MHTRSAFFQKSSTHRLPLGSSSSVVPISCTQDRFFIFFRLLFLLTFTLWMMGRSQAQPVTIDDWMVDQAQLSVTFPPAGASLSSVVTGPSIIGFERDLLVNLTGGTINGYSLRAGVGDGFFSLSQDATIKGGARVEWDGFDNDPSTINPTGLGGVDLTSGWTQDALLLRSFFNDLPTDVVLRVYSGAGNVSVFNFTLPGPSEGNYAIPFNDFSVESGAGANFTDVGAISLSAGSGSTSPDLVLLPLGTTSILTATLIDNLWADIDSDGIVDAGDIIRYTAVITNPVDDYGTTARDVTFDCSVDPNTALLAGTVTTSHGSVIQGNGSGDSSVSINLYDLPDGSEATMTFQVRVQSPLAMGISQVTCQGFVSSDQLNNLPTDDPSEGGWSDPTVTPVTATPNVTATMVDSLLVDLDGDGLTDEGDTLRYTVVLTNTGDRNAGGILFSSSIDPFTTLVLGSVSTTQGTVTSGNTVGDTTVAVDVGTIAGLGGSLTIQFSVKVKDPVPMNVTRVESQGSVTGSNIVSLKTDDPDTPAPQDPTVTPLDFDPLITATLTDILFMDLDGDLLADEGDTLRYLLEITNTGRESASNVQFTTGVSPDTALLVGSVTTTQGHILSGETVGDVTVTVNLETLPANEGVAWVAFLVKINKPVPLTTFQVACQGLVTSNNYPDLLTDDHETVPPADPTVTVLDFEPLIHVTLTADLLTDQNSNGMADPGDSVLYTAWITNTGRETAQGVEFSSGVDPHTTLVVGSVTTSQGSVTEGNDPGHTAVSVFVGSVAGLVGSITIEFVARIDDLLPPDVLEIVCQGLVTGQVFPDTPTDDPTTPQEGDATAVQVFQPPVANCARTISRVLTQGCSVLVTGQEVDNGSFDPDGGNLTFTLEPAGPFSPGATQVTLTVTDDENQSSSCVATIIVEDGAPPTAVCKDVTVFLDESGSVILSPQQVDGGSSDNCSIHSMTVTPPIFGCGDIGPNQVVLTVMDPSFQIDQCTATVTVLDASAPEVTCRDIEVFLGPDGTVSITPEQVLASATDNCGEPLTFSVEPDSFTCDQDGPNTVTLTVSDGSGNVAQCSAVVTVLDHTPPAFECIPSETVVAGPAGTAPVPDYLSTIIASDNCTPPDQFLIVQDPSPTTPVGVGITIITITVADNANNISSCTAELTVLAPTPTPSLTFTPSFTPTPTLTTTQSFTPSITQTRTSTPTRSFTQTRTFTQSRTYTATPTASGTPTFTPTNSPTPTITNTPGCDSGLYMLITTGQIIRAGNPPLVQGELFYEKDFALDMERAIANEGIPGTEDLVVMDGAGVVTFMDHPADNIPTDFLFPSSPEFPLGRAVDIEMSGSSEGFWLLTDFGGIYRAGDTKEPGDPSLVPGTDILLPLGYDVPFGFLRSPELPNPGGSSLRAVALVVVDAFAPFNRAEGYIVFDSMGARYQIHSGGGLIPSGTYTGLPDNDPRKLLEPAPNGYVYPMFPGRDICRDAEIHPSREGLVVFDGWGGIHPVPVDQVSNPVYFTHNDDPLNPGSLITTTGMPYVVAGFDDPETPDDDESDSGLFGIDVYSIFTDFDFSAGCPDGFYTLDKFGAVFVFGSARVKPDDLSPAWPLQLISSQNAIDMELYRYDETGEE